MRTRTSKEDVYSFLSHNCDNYATENLDTHCFCDAYDEDPEFQDRTLLGLETAGAATLVDLETGFSNMLGLDTSPRLDLMRIKHDQGYY